MLLYALETIDHQLGDPFVEDLEEIIVTIYDKADSGQLTDNAKLFKTDIPKRIETLIKSRFNLSVVMDDTLHHYLPAAIIPFSSDYLSQNSHTTELLDSKFNEVFNFNNIYKHIQAIDKEKKAYYRRIHNRTGYVDRRRVWVSGYLADVKHYLIMNFWVLKQLGLTPREVVGVVLHEIGHAFKGLTNHHRLMSNNLAIVESLNELNDNNQKRALYVFKRHFGKDDIMAADLDTDGPVTDFYPVLAKTYLGSLESQLIDNKYDETTFEASADSFAARFGVGKDLVSGLHKIHVVGGHVVYDNRLAYFSLLAVEILVTAAALILFGPIGVALFLLVVLFFSGTHNQHMTYDLPVDRYTRIKQNIISGLKQKGLSAKFTKELLSQLEFIDGIIKKTQERKALSDFIANLILPGDRKSRYYIEVQKCIEHSLNNDLFVSSAKLSTQ